MTLGLYNVQETELTHDIDALQNVSGQ